MANDPSAYRAVVDMGSNGIRTSITDLSKYPYFLRTLYADRVGISLYDAQFSKQNGDRQPLSTQTIAEVVRALKRFKQTCTDFGVQDNNVTVVATEATRTAINADELLSAIQEELAWEVRLLSKKEEAVTGAAGIATSVPEVNGLAMDLGGGSVQLMRMNTLRRQWDRKMEKKAISLPYGAAALLKRLDAAILSAKQHEELKTEVTAALDHALRYIGISDSKVGPQGTNLYLSGGGFRGWGYLLMSLRSAYPIPWVNGFQVTSDEFLNIESVNNLVASSTSTNGDGNEPSLFRVSQRRLKQLPATRLLIECLAAVLPKIGTVTFCQGGTEAGVLWSNLPSHSKHPLRFGYALTSATVALTTGQSQWPPILELILSSLPIEHSLFDRRAIEMVHAFAQAMYAHAPLVKDVRASTALRYPTHDVVGSTTGITHFERAALAILLVERWGGLKELPSDDQKVWHAMYAIVGTKMGWWYRYIGRIAALIGTIWPVKVPKEANETLQIRLKNRMSFDLEFRVAEEYRTGELEDSIKRVEKLGKKKHWANIEGSERLSLKITSSVSALDRSIAG